METTAVNCRRINRFWFIHAIKHFSALKKNKLLIHARTYINLRSRLLSERSWIKKAAYYMLQCLLQHCGKCRITGTGQRWLVSVVEGGRRELTKWGTKEVCKVIEIPLKWGWLNDSRRKVSKFIALNKFYFNKSDF